MDNLPIQEGLYLQTPEGEFYYVGDPVEDFYWDSVFELSNDVYWYSDVYFPPNYNRYIFVVEEGIRVLIQRVTITRIDTPDLKLIGYKMFGKGESYIFIRRSQ